MVVTNLKRKTGYVWIPPQYSAGYKVEIVKSSDGSVIDVTSILNSIKITDGVTNTIGNFEMKIFNPSNTYTNYWEGGVDTIKYYCDYSNTITSLRFGGLIEKVDYKDNMVVLSGRSHAVKLLEITVTKQYDNIETSLILKDLIDSYGNGEFTYTNVELSTTNLSPQWYQKPFMECINELCTSSNSSFYIDASKDTHYFPKSSRTNTGEAIIHSFNLLETRGFTYDTLQIKNRVIVYGAKQDGIQIIFTALNNNSITKYGVRELIHKNDNITTRTQASEIANFLLNQTPPLVGEVVGLLLATIQPGERIRLSDPDNNIIPGFYDIGEYTIEIDTENIMTTTVTVNKGSDDSKGLFSLIVNRDYQKQETDVNPEEMRYSYNFLFDSDSGSHTNTQMINGVLKTTSGSSGTWISPSQTETNDITQAYLIIIGTVLDGVQISLSVDNGLTYTNISNKTKITFGSPGKALKVKAVFTNSSTEIDSLSVQYKTVWGNIKMVFTRESFKELWDDLFNWRINMKKDSEVMELKILDTELESKATQKDKPSPHSSLTLNEAKKILRKAFPNIFTHWITSVSNTNSMEPFIDDNSIVVTEKITPSVLEKQPIIVGDIIIWYRAQDNIYIIHRVKTIDLSKTKFFIQGDNNYFADGWVPLELIKYRYVGHLCTQARRENDWK